MKKIVLTFGLISGAIMSGLMTAVIVFAHQTDPGRGMVIGYTIMVLESGLTAKMSATGTSVLAGLSALAS